MICVHGEELYVTHEGQSVHSGSACPLFTQYGPSFFFSFLKKYLKSILSTVRCHSDSVGCDLKDTWGVYYVVAFARKN